MSGSDSDSSVGGEKVRISLILSTECTNPQLEVPSDPIAVPADITRKGLSAVINHILGREVDDHKSEGNDDETNKDETTNDDQKQAAIVFDFIVGRSNKLLRTSLEREVRRSGLNLEEAIPVTYFPAQQVPELKGESDPEPDWISSLSFANSILCAGCYDGSLHVYETENGDLLKIVSRETVHEGPIKASAAFSDDSGLWIATGSMDQSLMIHYFDVSEKVAREVARCTGLNSAIGCLDWLPTTKILASGDWEGGVSLYKVGDGTKTSTQSSKKTKTTTAKVSNDESPSEFLTPYVSIRAHASNISGISWGNFEKRHQGPIEQLITGSWDHSLKVWNIERQDCLLTLNGSRVITCMDTSPHSAGIVATGHPDCTIRLWDLRIGNEKESSCIVSDNTFRPSHKAWVSSVQWSPDNAYHLASASHDGTVKLWDIRSSSPLQTVNAFGKAGKALSFTYGNTLKGIMYTGGTDGRIKQFQYKRGNDA